MKTLFALLLTVNLMGNVSPDYISTFYYDPSVTISFENWKAGTLNVKIMDENSSVIFDDKLNTRKSDGIKYNLKNLATGKYNIVLENDLKKVVETVILFDGKIVEKEATVYFKPVITMVNGNAEVNFLSANGTAQVIIYRNDSKVYFEEFNNGAPLNKIFNLNNLRPGSYSLVVQDEFVSRTHTFEK